MPKPGRAGRRQVSGIDIDRAWSKLAAVKNAGLVCVLLGLAGCANSPPSVPIVLGPTRVRMADTALFTAMSVDKDGDSLSYYFEWGGGPPSGWTDWVAEGEEAVVLVAFTDSGDCWVRVKARDREAETGWSDTDRVSVRAYGPHVPRRPSGPDTVMVGDTVAFVSSASHPLAELVALQFRLGDSLSDWSGFVLPETLVFERYSFTAAGPSEVRCRAKDRGERLSDWSRPETVVVVDSLRFIR
jgi:hypothetical protein